MTNIREDGKAMNILFICTGNTCRSPMAKALFLKRLQEIGVAPETESFQIFSAGLSARDDLAASPQAIAVMGEEGVDISVHRSVHLRTNSVLEADLILTMTTGQRDYIKANYPERADSIYTLSEYTGDEAGEVLDPYGQDINAYRQSLVQLKILVDRLINRIIESK